MIKRIIVSGATSMLGTALIDAAIKEETEVFALVRPGTTRINRLPDSPLVHVVEASISNLADTEGIPEDCDIFYHFAWAGTDKVSRKDGVIQNKNILYTLSAVRLAHKCGCIKFVGAGSQAEYGLIAGPIKKDTKCVPETAYGKAKLDACNMSKGLCNQFGMIHIWARIFSVYGPHDNDVTMVNYAIDSFALKKKAEFSAATQKWNYLYESDAGKIFYLIGEKVVSDSTFRVANNKSCILRDYIKEISRQMNADELCLFAKADSTTTCYGLEAGENELFDIINYYPQTDFTEGIKKTIESRIRKYENN